MAHLTRPAEISGVSAGLFPETAAGNRAYVCVCLQLIYSSLISTLSNSLIMQKLHLVFHQ